MNILYGEWPDRPIYFGPLPSKLFSPFNSAETAATPRDTPEVYGPPAPGQPAGEHFVHHFAKFARLLPERPHPVPPPLLGRVPPPPSSGEALKWYGDYKQLRETNREQRYAYLENGIVAWNLDQREQPLFELLGKLSLYLTLLDQLWKEFVYADTRLPCFRSGNEFIACYLKMWGLCDKPSRISHLKNSARFWCRIVAAGLPPPDNLSCLEELSRKNNALKTYARLVKEAGDVAPPNWAIAQYIESTKSKTKLANSLSKQSDNREILPELRTKLSELAELEKNEPTLTPAFRAKLQELYLLAEPEAAPTSTVVTAPVPEPEEPDEKYDARLGPPLTVQESGAFISVTFDYAPERERTEIRRYAARNRWDFIERDGTVLIQAKLSPTNTSEAHAVRRQVWAWAHSYCRGLGAPLPEGSPSSLPAAGPKPD